MAVDSRLKRQSATCMLLPQILSGVFPDTSGVVQAERQGISWMYSGILAIASTLLSGKVSLTFAIAKPGIDYTVSCPGAGFTINKPNATFTIV